MNNNSLPLVDILMAAYNGEKYISDQIDSILTQTYPNINLIVRDDGSQDSSRDIIEQKIKQYPGKITLLPAGPNLHVIRNFSALMEVSQSDYVMFADQDDIWLPEKVSKTFCKLHQLEETYGKATPLLVHTDLHVVNATLQTIHPSFWNYSRLAPKKSRSFNRVLAQNSVTGNTMMMNKPLVKLACPIPANVMMHDWWVALVAAAFGHIGLIEESLILYRQHGKNQLGAQKGVAFWRPIASLLIHPRRVFAMATKAHARLEEQAVMFAKAYSDKLNQNQKNMLTAFCRLNHISFFKALYLRWKYAFYKQGLLRNTRTMFSMSEFIRTFSR